ncbi:hypothetical protein P9J82_08910 [Glaesserella parasuis]|uniref:Uncharacterized protein n=1 Tax=Glaesserella parasuis TaxID=738 RepID=A0AAJ6DAF1_GLAPU|nr:hypothetical protein [Glaesserella parasuis]EQA04940.1 putative ferredoxin [Glaesserella parasuis 12939]MDD2175014.1 hypothetical protein [Glaesserella parasuis]MDE3986855.1 hypothetical protein [Glaesserella parasuis]MDG6227989.1 hypothetical protein [Glaesserella parasuis]MDG6233894.1 hypothetical protein [Glaesserella parasuis]
MNTISRRGLFRSLLGGTQKSVSTEIARQVAPRRFLAPNICLYRYATVVESAKLPVL